ncbi:Proteasome-interacting protein CIC1 [Nakaseomyces glabratus]|uniref:Proteasome-interacting protein CIC1 n=1 Tax=Candida glabrata TaxID=5478 RepID=A0A0W0DW80_CANGB|nr:Proteasome-interacting protein CIC1 [Nakaseomyces glabratus]KTB00887.1 Proteasome-interacting protein CIC1 [Nakaseomyces glabratus]KTB02076.1 Proteasome-interacting protein CIC1 [Nakaseomyces glabratus]KTB16004.1 Proteasome-interacting protein CIC1 [Nakaseomyces glabratus]
MAKKGVKKQVKNKEEGLSRERIGRALGSLRKYLEAQEGGEKTQLLEDESLGDLQLLFTNAESFTGSKKSFKLKLVDVKHSLYAKWKAASATEIKDFKVLLILKDSDVSKVTQDELYDQLNESGIEIDEIICGKDLKTTYKAYEARNAFISQFSLVIADDSVVTALPKLLGGKAYSKVETTPIPIRCNLKGQFSLNALTNQIKKIYLHKLPVRAPRGNMLNVHLGRVNWFTDEEIIDNIESVADALIKDAKIRNIMLKTTTSPSLPIYRNDNVIDEMVKENTVDDEKAEDVKTVKIGEVDVELSNFDRALMEVANPEEYETMFSKQISKAKRAREEEPEVEEKTPVKKGKNDSKQVKGKKSPKSKK